MKFMILIPTYLLCAQICWAENIQTATSTDAEFIDVEKGMSWLSKNSNRIYSLVIEVDVLNESSGKTTTIKSEFVSPSKSEDCEKYDVDKAYTNYFYYSHTEDLNTNEAGYSAWFEGRKMDGTIVKKTIAFCFAN